MRISLFVPCYVDHLFPEVARSMVAVLRRLGHDVDCPPNQTCCGQPAFNAGYFDEARPVAEHFLRCFGDAEVIVAPSGSCVSMVRVFYRELFENHHRRDEAIAIGERTFEFSQLLVEQLGVLDVGARFNHTVTFHDGCHGLRELGIRRAPRTLLQHVEGLELVEMDEAETCCGFGGTFSIKFPQISTSMAEVKAASVERSGAEFVISNDSSCLMQLQGYFERHGVKARCLHLAEVLNSVATPSG